MAMRFTYRSGERPLAGYTLKRGVGQGGFGEVYFAVSDSGKEVALKLLRGSTDVELRGVANCLNLKHPNLVHIYDLKTDHHGDTWLVMEYVLGESLAQVIDRHPNGLSVQLVNEWFQSLARAVGYLHDHGVVHRDLKPANIFIEHGNLKVGDYGLCKAMAASNRQQTRTVGTVHYMAPEIASGNYTKSIDIYACGVVLHEMLTGKLPFEGESDGEILMKHLTATPDLKTVPEAFRPIISKALDKNPLKRFGSMLEFARAVAMAQPVPQVNVPVMVARPVPEEPKPEAKPEVAEQIGVVSPTVVPVAEPKPILPATQVAAPVLAQVRSVPSAVPARSDSIPLAVRDRLMDFTGAVVKSPFIVMAAILPWALMSGTYEWAPLGKVFLLSLSLSWLILLTTGHLRYKANDTWSRRFKMMVIGILIGSFAYWFDGTAVSMAETSEDTGTQYTEQYLWGAVQLPMGDGQTLVKYALYFGCALGAIRWWRMTARDRKERFGLFPAIAAAFWGAVLMFLWPYSAASVAFGIVPLVVAAITVQWVSPWLPPPPPMPRRLRWKSA